MSTANQTTPPPAKQKIEVCPLQTPHFVLTANMPDTEAVEEQLFSELSSLKPKESNVSSRKNLAVHPKGSRTDHYKGLQVTTTY